MDYSLLGIDVGSTNVKLCRLGNGDGERFGVLAHEGDLEGAVAKLVDQLGIPKEKVEAMAPRLQELIGYGTYRHLIGHIDRKSPLSLLRDHEQLTVWDLADQPKK